MPRKIMMINATDPEEIRCATLVEGVLDDFDLEYAHNEKIKGNIYKAKVVRVDQSLQAAFVNYGAEKNGFLPLTELPKDWTGPDGRRGRIQDILTRDKEILVQAIREEMGAKGAMLTAQISLAGRYLVITPGSAIHGISRRIESREEREHFKKLVDELDIPESMGVIVRTASLGVTKEDFQRDLEYLLDIYREVQNRYNRRQGPGLVWQEDDLVTRVLRDYFSTDVEEVYIDDEDTYRSALTFFKRTMPQQVGVLRHYSGKKPLFSKYQLEDQIDRMYSRRVPLPSGGAIVLDQTEALVAIDVNSGKTAGENQEDTAFRTNLEAAEEVARQLRLRDMAGLVVIDFIDMKREPNIRAIQERLVECLRQDKARMEVGKINRFGVLVLTRQRIRPSVQSLSHETCPMCCGTGQVKTLEAMSISALRRIKAVLSRDDVSEIRLKLAPSIAMLLLNQRRGELAAMEGHHSVRILVNADSAMTYGEMVMEIEREEKEKETVPPPPRRERNQDEDQTIVLGGDSPISFKEALTHPENGKGERKTESFKARQRDFQKAALEDRERMRALFESALPELEAGESPKAEMENQGSQASSPSSSVDIVSSETTTDVSAPSTDIPTPPQQPEIGPEVLAALAKPSKRPGLRSKVPVSQPPIESPETASPKLDEAAVEAEPIKTPEMQEAGTIDAPPSPKPKRGRPSKPTKDRPVKKTEPSPSTPSKAEPKRIPIQAIPAIPMIAYAPEASPAQAEPSRKPTSKPGRPSKKTKA